MLRMEVPFKSAGKLGWKGHRHQLPTQWDLPTTLLVGVHASRKRRETWDCLWMLGVNLCGGDITERNYVQEPQASSWLPLSIPGCPCPAGGEREHSLVLRSTLQCSEHLGHSPLPESQLPQLWTHGPRGIAVIRT